MKVLIDCTQITKQKAGVGIYARNMIAEMVKAEPGAELILLAQDDDPEMYFRGLSKVTMILVNARWFRKLPLRFLLEQFYIPFLAIKHSVDVVHSLHYSFPLLPLTCKKVVTVHDMTSYKMPEVHLRTKVLYFRFFLRAASYLADELIFISHSTQTDYLSYFHKKASCCHVIPLGKSAEFKEDLDPQHVAEAIEKYGIGLPYILYVGTIEPRKNLNRLVKAFAATADKDSSYSLVIAGKKGWMYNTLFELILELKLENRVLFTGFVAESDKPYLIRGAEIFAYVSLYEGFGIPVLESLACGVPTLTSNISSIPEVVGKAALLVDPYNEAEIAAGLERLMLDEVLRDDLTTASLARAAHFTWESTAANTLQVYRKASKR